MPSEPHIIWQGAKKNALTLAKVNSEIEAKTKKVLDSFDQNFGKALDKMVSAIKKARQAGGEKLDADVKKAAQGAIEIAKQYHAKVLAAEKAGSSPGLKWLHDDGIPKLVLVMRQYADEGAWPGWARLK
jgi:hypothetical protein